MVPFELWMLIECCVSAEPGCENPQQWNSIYGRYTRQRFQSSGVMDADGRGTEKASQWLGRILLSAELTRPDEDGGKIVEGQATTAMNVGVGVPTIEHDSGKV